MNECNRILVDALLSGEPVNEAMIVLLIYILSTGIGGLMPETIDGIKPSMMSQEDPRHQEAVKRVQLAKKKAFKLIRGSHWYEENRWPVESHGDFRGWINFIFETRGY